MGFGWHLITAECASISAPYCFLSSAPLLPTTAHVSNCAFSLRSTARSVRGAPRANHTQACQPGSGSGVRGLGFRVQGSGFRVQGLGFRVQGSGFRVQGSGFRVQGSGFRVQGSEFRLQSLGFRLQSFGFTKCRVPGTTQRGKQSRGGRGGGCRGGRQCDGVHRVHAAFKHSIREGGGVGAGSGGGGSYQKCGGAYGA